MLSKNKLDKVKYRITIIIDGIFDQFPIVFKFMLTNISIIILL